MTGDDGLTIATVTITRTLTADDDAIRLNYEPAGLPLVEVLGMLTLATDSAIREAMGEGDE